MEHIDNLQSFKRHLLKLRPKENMTSCMFFHNNTTLDRSKLWLTYEKIGYWITTLKVCSTVDVNAHRGLSWQHVFAFLGSHLQYTHAFYRICHPHPPNAVLDYYSRIWIYLRQVPIKLQIGRSMRPTQTPIPRLGFVGEILLSVVGSVTG